MVFYLTLTVLGIVGLVVNMKSNKGKTMKIQVEKFSNITDQHFLSYFSLFVLLRLVFN